MTLQSQIDELLSQQASEWIEVLRRGSARDRARFIQWVSESPRHLDAWLTTALLDEQLEKIDLLSLFDEEQLRQQIEPQIAVLRRATQAQTEVPRVHAARKWWWAASIAAAVAMVSLAIATYGSLFPTWRTYSTAIGEQRSIRLPDGSIAFMNADSVLQVRFSESERDLRLRNGEAMFKVVHDEQRRFRVQTRDAVVEAIGTQFNVHARESGTTVSVIEGRVQVATGDAMDELGQDAQRSEAARVDTLGAGDVASVTLAGEIVRKRQANVLDAIAWRQRQLIFTETPLEDVVAEINRYNRSPTFRVEGIPPRSRHYSGTFDADDPVALAAFLSRERDLRIERVGNEIFVRGAATSSPER